MNDELMRQKRWRKKLKRKREIERRLKAYGSTSKPMKSEPKVVEKPKEEKVWTDSSKVKETTLLKRIIRFLSKGKFGN